VRGGRGGDGFAAAREAGIVHPLDRGIRLIWGSEPVGTNSENLSLGQDFHFEGFRIWQLQSNNTLFPPKVVATYDEDDSVSAIYSDLFNAQKGGVERTLVVSGTNSGLRFSVDLTTDANRGGRLVNNKEYYYAITSYSFDVNNTSTFFLGPNPIGTIAEVLETAGFARKIEGCREAGFRLANHRLQPLGHLTAARNLSIRHASSYGNTRFGKLSLKLNGQASGLINRGHGEHNLLLKAC